MKKILNRVGDILLITLVVFLVLVAYGSLNNRWYKVVVVEGNSMSPSLWFGDLIVLTPPTQHIPEGKIITMQVDGGLVTHRLIAKYDGEVPKTKGDANAVSDNFEGYDIKIVGIVRLRIPWLGYPKLYFDYLVNKL